MKHRALFIVLLLATAALSGIVIGRFAFMRVTPAASPQAVLL